MEIAVDVPGIAPKEISNIPETKSVEEASQAVDVEPSTTHTSCFVEVPGYVFLLILLRLSHLIPVTPNHPSSLISLIHLRSKKRFHLLDISKTGKG